LTVSIWPGRFEVYFGTIGVIGKCERRLNLLTGKNCHRIKQSSRHIKRKSSGGKAGGADSPIGSTVGEATRCKIPYKKAKKKGPCMKLADFESAN